MERLIGIGRLRRAPRGCGKVVAAEDLQKLVPDAVDEIFTGGVPVLLTAHDELVEVAAGESVGKDEGLRKGNGPGTQRPGGAVHRQRHAIEVTEERLRGVGARATIADCWHRTSCRRTTE